MTNRIAQNLAIACLVTGGPGWPWNMVAGYWLLILRMVRWLIASGRRDAESGRPPAWKITAVAVLILTALTISALALFVPSSSWG